MTSIGMGSTDGTSASNDSGGVGAQGLANVGVFESRRLSCGMVQDGKVIRGSLAKDVGWLRMLDLPLFRLGCGGLSGMSPLGVDPDRMIAQERAYKALSSSVVHARWDPAEDL